MKILVLEDDLGTLSGIFSVLRDIEDGLKVDMHTTSFSEYTQAERLNSSDEKFDIILLDRDCKIGGSFHVLDFDKFGVEKIIAISSMPEYNEQARQKGVKRIVFKDYSNLEEFFRKLKEEIVEMIKK